MTFLYETLGVPFGFLLKLIYQSVGFHNYAISIILLTLFSRLIMTPSTISQQKGMAKTQRLQPRSAGYRQNLPATRGAFRRRPPLFTSARAITR